MWKRLNLKWDRRTLLNVISLPLIIFVRIPFVLIYFGVEYVRDKMESFCDYLPGWNSP